MRTSVSGSANTSRNGLSWLELLVTVLAGAAGAGLLMAAFPSAVLPRITHRTLGLPGPGSGVAVIGPLVALVAVLAYLLVKKRGVMLVCCAVLGTLHSIFMEELFPSAKTVGTVGPLPLRILAVVVLGVVLELTAWLLAGCNRWLRYLAPGACGSLAFLVFYWAVIYPFMGKRPATLQTCAILGALTATAGAVVGGLLPAMLDRSRRRP